MMVDEVGWHMTCRDTFENPLATQSLNRTDKFNIEGVLFYSYMINNAAFPPVFAPSTHCLIVVACPPEQLPDLKHNENQSS